MATPNGSIPPVHPQDLPANLQMLSTLSITPANTPAPGRRLSWIDEKDHAITPGTKFEEAGRLSIESRVMFTATGKRARGYIRKNTEMSYRNELGALNLFFGETRLCDIRLDHFTKYQRLRIAGAEPFIRKRRPHEEPGPCPVKAQQVNQELESTYP